MYQSTRIILIVVLALAASSFVTACGGGELRITLTTEGGKNEGSAAAARNDKTGSSNEEFKKPVKLKLAMWNTRNELQFWSSKAKEYNRLHPHVTVEVEMVHGNNDQYLKVRMAANDMPDLFFLKPSYFHTYKDVLLPLHDISVTAINKKPMVINGEVLGLPLVSFTEYVFYHPGILEELGLEVPRTLEEWLDVMERIGNSGQYTPLALGGKDSWTFYPLLEFGPMIHSGNRHYLADMAGQSEPFRQGSSFHAMAELIQQLANRGYAGKDALSVSYDSAMEQFESGKAAMIVLGQWYYSNYVDKVGDDENLGVFPLPLTSDTSGPPHAMVMTDMHVGISRHSDNVEEAKAFLNWMFSEDIYREYIAKVEQDSTVEGIEHHIPFFEKWEKQNPYEPFYYEGPNEQYALISSAVQYDPKFIAQEIFAGRSIEELMGELNARWGRAKEAAQATDN
ncbi:ABC transporter substrate-binding protein [Paenibacillus chungangensis]|uniref:ABC transporter substrate-binding protein n=1 Tax=Paenibacillus chungangensis TaxID=696535 RepID=A0ABW3HTC2_9BACL